MFTHVKKLTTWYVSYYADRFIYRLLFYMKIFIFQLNIGSFNDVDVPLKYCARLLISKFLLAGHAGNFQLCIRNIY